MRVHAAFESGNVEDVAIVRPDHVRLRARPDQSLRPLWFYFCIDETAAPAVRVDLVNADDCFGGRTEWTEARPVFSGDGIYWQRIARASYVEETLRQGYFTFQVPIVGRRTYVAYCFPYTTTDLRRFLVSLPPALPDATLQIETWGRTAGGRSIPAVRLGPSAAAPRRALVIARQHAGETPASFVAEGLIAYLAGEDETARAARAAVEYQVVPMLDLDGVFHGRYGKDALPIDFNRDWSDRPFRPEIAALVSRVEQWAVSATGRNRRRGDGVVTRGSEADGGQGVRRGDRSGPAFSPRHPVAPPAPASLRRREERPRLKNAPSSLFLDLHGGAPGDRSCYLFGPPPEADARQRQAIERLMEALAAEAPPALGMRAEDLRPEAPPPHSARAAVAERCGIPSACLEISYHQCQSGEWMSPDHYRALGAALARAIYRQALGDG